MGRGENQRSTAIRQVVKMLKTWPTQSLLKFFCSLLCIVSFSMHAEPQLVLRVAAASDLRDALNAISLEFQRTEPGIPVQIVFGSSGKLSQQIQHGAPYDLYFSADMHFAEQLWQKGFAQQAPVAVGRGHLVLVTRATLQPALRLADLTAARFRRIAIAEPQHAPYGDRAKQAIEKSGLWNKLENKIVYGENVAKTFQLVQSGAADAALVGMALVTKPEQIQPYPMINQDLHSPLITAFIKIKRAQSSPQISARAHQFSDFMRSNQAQQLLLSYGFTAP